MMLADDLLTIRVRGNAFLLCAIIHMRLDDILVIQSGRLIYYRSVSDHSSTISIANRDIQGIDSLRTVGVQMKDEKTR